MSGPGASTDTSMHSGDLSLTGPSKVPSVDKVTKMLYKNALIGLKGDYLGAVRHRNDVTAPLRASAARIQQLDEEKKEEEIFLVTKCRETEDARAQADANIELCGADLKNFGRKLIVKFGTDNPFKDILNEPIGTYVKDTNFALAQTMEEVRLSLGVFSFTQIMGRIMMQLPFGHPLVCSFLMLTHFFLLFL